MLSGLRQEKNGDPVTELVIASLSLTYSVSRPLLEAQAYFGVLNLATVLFSVGRRDERGWGERTFFLS